MIIQIDTSRVALPASGEITRSKWYGLRILRAASGATISWGTPKDAIGAFAGALYENIRGLNGLWVTGSVVLEYTDDPAEAHLPPVSVSGSSLDGANNLQVVGPAADAAAASGAPVLVAGKDPVSGFVRTLSVVQSGDAINSGAAHPGGRVLIAGVDQQNSVARDLSLDGAGSLVPQSESKDLSGNSPAAPGTVVGVQFFPRGVTRRAQFVFRVRGATGGTLDIYLQTRINGLWHDVAHLPQLAAAAALVAYAVALNADSGVPAAPLAGLNTLDGTPTLAVNTTRNLIGDAWQVVFVAGAGTSAGAAQSIGALVN